VRQALAAENVSLDNSLLEAKSSLLKAERAAREAAGRADKLEAQLGAATSRAAAAEQQVEDMTTERRLLLARAMQAEAAAGAWGAACSLQTLPLRLTMLGPDQSVFLVMCGA
jgi:hypothetical protein